MTPESPDPQSTPIELLMYASRSTADPSQVDAIVAAARRNNAARSLTGVLLFSGGHFLQVLEGPAAAIGALQPVLEADPRHTAVTVLLRTPVPARRFGLWSMALLGMDGADALIQALLAAPPADDARPRRLLARIEALAAESGRVSGPA